MKNATYMACTNDRLELPVFVTDNVSEMADFLGMSVHTVHVRANYYRKNKGTERKKAKYKVYTFHWGGRR